MPQALEIAAALERIAEVENGQGLTPMELLKLAYYAQAVALVETAEPLFEGRFEAWTHGPVEPEIWRFTNRTPHWREELAKHRVQLSDDAWALLRAVHSVFGGLNAFQLRGATHTERPWLRARAGKTWDEPSDDPISQTSILDFYAEVIEDGEDVMAQLKISPEPEGPWWALPYRLGVNVKRLAGHPFFDDAASRDLRRAMGLGEFPDDWTGLEFRPLDGAGDAPRVKKMA
jgi:uncharacterized phage-associated protein